MSPGIRRLRGLLGYRGASLIRVAKRTRSLEEPIWFSTSIPWEKVSLYRWHCQNVPPRAGPLRRRAGLPFLLAWAELDGTAARLLNGRTDLWCNVLSIYVRMFFVGLLKVLEATMLSGVARQSRIHPFYVDGRLTPLLIRYRILNI